MLMSQNHDLCYAYSPLEDGFPGRRWYNLEGAELRSTAESSIETEHDTKVFDIPKFSGVYQYRGPADCRYPQPRSAVRSI